MSSRKRRIIIGCGVALAVTALGVAPVWGSIFGEENGTLIQILAQIIQAKKELQDINDAASKTADTINGLLDTYQSVNAGIDELKSYSFDAFLSDLKTDLYNQYPGIGKLEHASSRLARWETTRTRSPFTAYEAITAVVADVSKPLRDDIAAGRANVDEELILSSEAAGGFAAAHTAEQATQRFDDQAKDLARVAQRASPGQAEQISARANVLLVTQQSHVMRLLARAVRLESMRAALEYGGRMHAKNAAYAGPQQTTEFARQALSPPKMIDFAQEL